MILFSVIFLLASPRGVAQDCSSLEITNISVDHISCNGLSNGRITIEIAGGLAPYEYSINNGVDFQPVNGTVVMAAGLVAGMYEVVVKDDNNCTLTFNGNPLEIIEPDQLEIELEVTQRGCPGDNLGEITVLGFGGTMPYTYLWTDGSTGVSISGLEPGQYSCTLTDAGACKVATDISYLDFSEVIIDTGPDLIIQPGEVEQFNISVNIQEFSIIQWSPAEGLSDATALNPFASPLATTTYELFVLSADGCIGMGEITIVVSENPFDVVLPNAFSPNADDHNDIFRPLVTTSAEISMMRIYNRWGEVVFQSTSELGWDGSYLGTPQPVGTYVYTIEYVDPDGERIKLSGEVNLIR